MPHGKPDVNSTIPTISWLVGEQTLTSAWRSENGWAPPKRTMLADDTMSADTAYRLASEGVALIWTGDFQNARQLLHALARRTAKRRPKYLELPTPSVFTKSDSRARNVPVPWACCACLLNLITCSNTAARLTSKRHASPRTATAKPATSCL